LEVTNAAGNGPPVNLASLSFTLGSSASLFTKTVTAANASEWIEMFKGPVGLTPGAPLALQAASLALGMVVRGKNGLPIDCMVRVAAVNIIETEAAAYGAPAFTGKAYNAGRPVIGSIPTMTPASGTYGEGTPININQPGTCLGGGLTRTFEVVNELGQVVGTCSPAYNGVAAVPYLVQAGDVGAGKTLKVRSHAGNGFGADYMDTATRPSA
ncbi:MAG TPA: hypothetical protein VEZ41_07815, partial [Allosphingosinicella sp.]|nr:hypothetical protein [Allosphingosinicella sp.]